MLLFSLIFGYNTIRHAFFCSFHIFLMASDVNYSNGAVSKVHLAKL